MEGCNDSRDLRASLCTRKWGCFVQSGFTRKIGISGVIVLVLQGAEQSTFGPSRETTEWRDPLNEKQAENLLMAKIIKFYIPNKLRKKATWVPPQQRGKLIEFSGRVKKSA